MIELLFHNVIASDPGVSGICGPRIYPIVLPTDPQLPCIAYATIGGTSNPTLDTSGLTRYRMEVNCFGSTYKEAITLRAAVSSALNGYYDGNITIEKLHNVDFFDHELLQYRALCEFYLFSTL